jgi:hypothetical protein
MYACIHDYLFLDALPLDWPPLHGEMVGVAEDSEDEDPMSNCRSLDLDQLILDTINNSEARDLEDFDSLSNDDVKNVCADLFRGKGTH